MKAKVIFWKHQTNKKGESPLMLRLSDGTDYKYKSLGISIVKDRWDEGKNCLKAVKPSKEKKYIDYKTLKDRIKEIEDKYTNKIEELLIQDRKVTNDKLIELVENPVKQSHTFYEYFNKRIKELENDEKYGNANAYKDTLRELNKFHSSDLYFYAVDLNFLQEFKKKLLKEGKKGTTISVYLRTIRAVYNHAIENNFAKELEYPFKRGNKLFKDLDTNTTPRAINSTELNSIKQLNVNDSLIDAKNYFLFGYYVGGINFVDMARLKYNENINYGRIEFKRFKIRSKNPELVSIGINEPIKNILDYYKLKTGINPDNFIFPILNKEIHKTEKQKNDRIIKVRKMINKNLKEIGKMAGVEAKLTTYVWRHTFASEAKNTHNANPMLTMEMMGQTSFEAHKKYLKNFDHKDIDKLAEAL